MPVVPKKERLTNGAVVCPHCNSKSYFDIENMWPELPPDRPKSHPAAQNSAFYDHLAKRFYVRALSCVGCKKIVVDIFPDGLDAKTKRIWPISTRPFPASQYEKYIPKSIINDFTEASKIETLSPTASATLSRRCLQTILVDKFKTQIGSSTKLKKQVEAVLAANILPSHIADELHSIRSIGNSAAHPNVDPNTNEIIDVEAGEASACLDVIEDLIDHAYVKPITAQNRRAEREKKYGPDNK